MDESYIMYMAATGQVACCGAIDVKSISPVRLSLVNCSVGGAIDTAINVGRLEKTFHCSKIIDRKIFPGNKNKIVAGIFAGNCFELHSQLPVGSCYKYYFFMWHGTQPLNTKLFLQLANPGWCRSFSEIILLSAGIFQSISNAGSLN